TVPGTDVPPTVTSIGWLGMKIPVDPGGGFVTAPALASTTTVPFATFICRCPSKPPPPKTTLEGGVDAWGPLAAAPAGASSPIAITSAPEAFFTFNPHQSPVTVGFVGGAPGLALPLVVSTISPRRIRSCPCLSLITTGSLPIVSHPFDSKEL